MSSLQSSINNEKTNLIVTGNDDLKYNNCVAIRQEIQRFESVHPSIYAIYDLLELNSDQVLSLRIREHLLSIEDSFVNSQEWTLSRNVPDLRLGIVGNLNSGKSALVHRYLTGSYMQDESPEGGRFKKEVFVNGQSNMLLIRDEGGAPEMQFSCWVDAVIFVFNADNLESFEIIKEYYQKFASFRTNLEHVPLILVSTQDTDSNCNRLIDEYTGRRLAEEMQRDCIYYETCPTYGHNVDKVFQDACQKIIQVRSKFGLNNCTSPINNHTPSYLNSNQTSYHPYSSSRPSTPNTTHNNNYMLNNNYYNGQINKQPSPLSTFNYQSPVSNQHQKETLNNSLRKSLNTPINKNLTTSAYGNLTTSLSASKAKEQHIFVNPVNPISQSAKKLENNNLQQTTNNLSSTVFTPISTIKEALQQNAPKNNPNLLPISTTIGSGQSLIKHHNTPTQNLSSVTINNKQSSNNTETPTMTPSTNRKARRRSNLFSVSSSKNKNLEEKSRNGELGSGRAIPIRQGYLHKKSVNSSLNTKLSLKNKEWKKKYVTLTTDGSLTYHSSLHDYMNDTHGKKISLMHTTVKIPGQRPRGSSLMTSTQNQNSMEGDFNRLNLLNSNQNNNNNNNNQIDCHKNLINESCIDGGNLLNERCVNCGSLFNSLDDRRIIQNTNSSLKDKDSNKKKHRRHKSNQLPLTGISTNVYCERCANLLDNGNNGFTFASNNNSKDSTNGNNEDDDFVFVIVSLDNKQWHFQAQSADDRELWLQAIENQILLSLQNIQSDKEKLRNNNSEQSNNEKIFKDRIRQIPGNNYCLDCDATNPTWASLNLGGLICIECSGIHRNLGTHISKVRSIDLDDWPQGNISVMLALGNSAVNKIWEYNTKNSNKPVPTSNRDEKESWIRRKYEQKEFLLPLNNQISIADQLENSILNQDVGKVFQIICQLNCNQTSLNEFKFNGNQRSTALQLAASTNNIAITQLIIWCSGNVNALDNYGQNALSYTKSKEMQDFLKSQGCTESTQLNKNVQRSPNNLILTDFSFRDKTATPLRDNLRDSNSSAKSTQMSNLVTSDVFDKLPTSII